MQRRPLQYIEEASSSEIKRAAAMVLERLPKGKLKWYRLFYEFLSDRAFTTNKMILDLRDEITLISKKVSEQTNLPADQIAFVAASELDQKILKPFGAKVDAVGARVRGGFE